ncbi:alpha/beta hydrolase [Aestuariibius insulae]|uniref:alpha/beta hydrolase n=1 Tax=Aestuariibius insulae TaxID=2058287 RepID=UPI00345E8F73
MDIDDAYANMSHIPEGDAYPARWARAAEAFRAQVRCELDLPYGEHPREVFDLFHPDRMAMGLLVLVHGGYWMRFDKSDFSHLAAGAVARGWAVAMPSYPLAPEMRVRRIFKGLRDGMGRVLERVPGPVVLAGHSAGGQLVLRLACRKSRFEGRERVERVMAISPITDLRPLTHTSMNEILQLTREEAVRESPALRHRRKGIDISVWVGANERPAFLEQARGIAQTWDGVELIEEPERHHFNVIDGLEEAESGMTRRLLRDLN